MIANADIAHMLQDYAALLEIQGESAFRVRAYQNAARTVENLSEPIARLMHEQGDLTALPGIGELPQARRTVRQDISTLAIKLHRIDVAPLVYALA